MRTWVGVMIVTAAAAAGVFGCSPAALRDGSGGRGEDLHGDAGRDQGEGRDRHGRGDGDEGHGAGREGLRREQRQETSSSMTMTEYTLCDYI